MFWCFSIHVHTHSNTHGFWRRHKTNNFQHHSQFPEKLGECSVLHRCLRGLTLLCFWEWKRFQGYPLQLAEAGTTHFKVTTQLLATAQQAAYLNTCRSVGCPLLTLTKIFLFFFIFMLFTDLRLLVIHGVIHGIWCKVFYPEFFGTFFLFCWSYFLFCLSLPLFLCEKH